MEAGGVDTLVMIDTNPVYGAPADLAGPGPGAGGRACSQSPGDALTRRP